MLSKADFKGYGKDEYDPSIRQDVAEFLSKTCKEENPKNILEIGTYIGYSAYIMLSSCNAKLLSIEKNPDNAKLATENLQKFSDRCKIITGDALEVIAGLTNEKFDIIFIDGAKTQYPKYLPFIRQMLNTNGLLIADNVHFHGYLKIDGTIPHKHRTCVNRIKDFLGDITTASDFDTKILDIGDGVSVSRFLNKKS